MYWINERCYKTLESAIAAYEEYKKNERILNDEGLTYLPRNLNFHNHYQEVVPDVIDEISAYDMLGNKIATWSEPSQNNTRVTTYVDFGPPGISDAPIGTLYFDKHTNKMWMLNSEKRWVHMANYDVSTTKTTEMFSLTSNIPARSFEKTNTPGKVYDLPKSYNCRNCGAPIRSCICEYCGTVY